MSEKLDQAKARYESSKAQAEGWARVLARDETAYMLLALDEQKQSDDTEGKQS